MRREENSYYLDNAAKIRARFDREMKSYSQAAASEAERDLRLAAAERARDIMTLLLPGIPYIGGKSNRLTFNLVASVWALGLIRALEEHGLEPREIGFQIHGFMEAYFNSRSKWLQHMLGCVFLSRPVMWSIKRRCVQSQQRRHPGDWVNEFVPPSPGEYAFGMDVRECGVCKFYETQGALAYARYICLGDYPMFASMGLGLRRTTTLANGGPCCDFRISRGETPSAWPPEKLAEFRSV